MIKHLASLAEDRLIISFAPKTLAYSILKRIGELFPGPSKVTQLQTSDQRQQFGFCIQLGDIVCFPKNQCCSRSYDIQHAHSPPSVFTKWPSMALSTHFWQQKTSAVQSGSSSVFNGAAHCICICMSSCAIQDLQNQSDVWVVHTTQHCQVLREGCGCCRQPGRIFMLRQMWRLLSNKRASK